MISGQEQRSFVFHSKIPAQLSFVDILAGIWRTLINNLFFCDFLMRFWFHGDKFLAGLSRQMLFDQLQIKIFRT